MTSQTLQGLIREVETVANFCDSIADTSGGHGNPEQAETAASIADLLRLAIRMAREDIAVVERQQSGATVQ